MPDAFQTLDLAQVYIAQVGSLQERPREICPGQYRLIQDCPSEVGCRKIGLSERRSLQHGSQQTGFDEPGPIQSGIPQIGVIAVRFFHVGLGEI
ncbi:hypothetical protein KDW_31900 [Dictyobacter vulcani]|uniref:Uncharacterized protein n=1 Tax=Dictyobacter vulcani TaxID=2607529 RepID=A0A5J4KH31_9CHLR|nr:hypothetical protein [Dictyobacter vulcani]GER89028.1 hypothetical protein KDW_31900 [Dictyobacter vulcani]